MLTPAGTDCKYYYQDFMRGRSQQECRLVKFNQHSAEWRPKDCTGCPVPTILQNNLNPNMVLEGSINKGVIGFGRKITVKAVCSKHLIDIPDPNVGCPECRKERPDISDLFKGL